MEIDESMLFVLQGRIEGDLKFGRQWAIPCDAKEPEDARVKSGKYKKEG